MITWMILLFAVGYLCIALENRIRINKSAVALLMAGILWTIFSLRGHDAHIGDDLVTSLGDTCEILIFLIGAMTIVDLIDMHGGFGVITRRITTRNKRKLLWLLALITFFMSAALDNMTTTIIMIMVMRRLVDDSRERWIFASMIVIAANSGGAWSPIGDVTTIMLWMRGNVSAGTLVAVQFVPCLVSVVLPAAICSRFVRSEALSGSNVPATSPVAASGHTPSAAEPALLPPGVTPRLSRTILITGVLSLLFVPVFKTFTHLPPYMGMMVSLGVMWVLTEIAYDRRRDIEESIQNRVSKVVKHIDMPTILFFLGILLSVSALQSAGVLGDLARWLDKHIHSVFPIAGVIGLLSSVIDNVPLVAACMGMYPLPDAAALATASDPAYLGNFTADGLFWQLLSFCAGVGGSLLIIGSTAGVVAMGLEKIEFGWYLRRIAPAALAGYFAGIGLLYLEHLIFGL